MSNDLFINYFIKESIFFVFIIVFVNIKDIRYIGFYDKIIGNCNCSLFNSVSCRIGMVFFVILVDFYIIGLK